MQTLDRWLDRTLGADMRLLYGATVPILMVCGLVALLCVSPSWWLLGAVMVGELVLTGVVILGFTGMLSESEDPAELRPIR